MDAPDAWSWREIQAWAADRDKWRGLLRALRQQPIVTTQLKKTVIHVKGRVANVNVRTSAERYRIRDAWAMFFKPSKAYKKETAVKNKKKANKKAKRKPKPRLWSDKERRKWTRTYYEKHYGKSKEGGV